MAYFGSTSHHPVATVEVEKSFHYEVHINGSLAQLPHTGLDVPSRIENLSDVDTVTTALEHARICNGCSLSKYEPLLEKRIEGGLFRDRSGAIIAQLEESWANNRCIRTTVCPLVIPEVGPNACSACRDMDSTLLRSCLSKFRSKQQEPSPSIHAPFIHLSRDDLLDRLRKEVRKNMLLTKQNKRLIAARERMESTKHNSEYALLFRQLEDGMDVIKQRVDHPVCKWASCDKEFSTIEELQTRIHKTHIHIDEGSSQLKPQYSCHWEACKHKSFKSKSLFKSHIARHTGKPEDVFFSVLLQDQAKALNMPPEQMRWHPCVLRWCLQQHSRSASSYEAMRDSGMLRLPSGRTLLKYGNYVQPKTGWTNESLEEMRDLYDKFISNKQGRPDRSFIGGLFWDEVKIKEGLVWNASTDELIGFVDHGDGSATDSDMSDDGKQLLATHVLQFHFKSVFSTFTFPCAFFLLELPKLQRYTKCSGMVYDICTSMDFK